MDIFALLFIVVMFGLPVYASVQAKKAKERSRDSSDTVKPLTAEEIEAKVKEIIAQTGASSIKEMGKVMGVASKQMAGKADGKMISDIVKKLLA